MSDLNVYYTVILKDGAIISIRSDGFRDPRILALLKEKGGEEMNVFIFLLQEELFRLRKCSLPIFAMLF